MSQVKSIVAILDVCSETVDHIHVVPTLSCAVRSISDLSRIKPDHEMVIHAKDYKLLHLGDIDMGSGLIVPLASPHVVCSVADCLNGLNLATDQGAAVGD